MKRSNSSALRRSRPSPPCSDWESPVRSARLTRLPSSGWPPMKDACRSAGGLADRLHHGVVQRRHGRVGPAGGRGLRHPGGMFEHFAECRDKGGGGQLVQAGKGQPGAGHCPNISQLDTGSKLLLLADQRV